MAKTNVVSSWTSYNFDQISSLGTQVLLARMMQYLILGESLFQGQKSPCELTLTEPVPEMFELVQLIGQKNIFLANQWGVPARELSPSYTMWFSSLIGVCHQKILMESLRKKRCNKAEETANCNMGARKQYSSVNFHGGLIEGILLILITNVHDFYSVVFGGAPS